MGCYKTTTAEFLLQDLGVERALIVTSKTGKITYEQTLPSVLGDDPVYRLDMHTCPPQLGHTHHRKSRDRGIFLAHYNLFTKRSPIAKALRSTDFDAIVLDESHRIKNRSAQCTNQITYLNADVKHVMTGSPFVNNPQDLWAQARFLDSSKVPGFWAFSDHFCDYDQDLLASRGFKSVVGIKQENKEQLKEWLRSFAVWRFKKDVFPDLPPKIRSQYDVKLNSIQRRMYNDIKAELQTMDEQGMPFHSPNVLSALSRLRQITSATPRVRGKKWLEKQERWAYDIELVEPSSKLDAVEDVLREASGQVVIFYTHTDVGRLLETRLRKRRISSINMLEKDSEKVRLGKVNAFQDGSAKVFHSTLSLGSESITLTAADAVFFVDRAWTPKDNNQGEDRVHRPGQTRPTNVVDFYGRGTTDGYVRAKVARKNGWFREVFHEEDVYALV
jgi:SNF2 family DNA or RNA helicase